MTTLTQLEENTRCVGSDWLGPGQRTWKVRLLSTYLKHPLSALRRRKVHKLPQEHWLFRAKFLKTSAPKRVQKPVTGRSRADQSTQVNYCVPNIRRQQTQSNLQEALPVCFPCLRDTYTREKTINLGGLADKPVGMVCSGYRETAGAPHRRYTLFQFDSHCCDSTFWPRATEGIKGLFGIHSKSPCSTDGA